MSIENLIDDFSFLESWEDKYKYLIELGNALPKFDDSKKIDEWKISGCQSQVWIIPHLDEDKKVDEWKIEGCQSQVWIIPHLESDNIYFEGDSDAIIVRGIIAIVFEIFKDKSAQEILDIDVEEIFDKLGLREHVSSNRRSGMLSMVDKIRYYAKNSLKG